MTSLDFDWRRPPAQVYLDNELGKFPTVYFRNNNSEVINSIPLSVDLNKEDLLVVSYIIRRYYADKMQKYIRNQINQNNTIENKIENKENEKENYPKRKKRVARSNSKKAGRDNIINNAIQKCLPIATLDMVKNDNGISEDLIDAKRLLNWFVYITSLIIAADGTFFLRDHDVVVPNIEIEDVIKHILHVYTVILENAIIGESEDDVGIAILFKALSVRIISVFQSGQKKITMKGGRHTNGMNDYLNNEIRNCITNIEDQIREYRDCIYHRITNSSNCWAIKQFINQISKTPDIPIYLNIKITFKTMFHAIGEIMNVFCLDLMPRLSMTNTIGASIFHMLYLKDIGLLGSFAHQINLPVLSRLITSCFPSCFPEGDGNNSEKHLKILNEQYPLIFNILSVTMPRLCKGSMDELKTWIISYHKTYVDEVDRIVTSLLSDEYKNLLTDNECLYYSINEIRGNTIEYYIIMLICQYTKTLILSENGMGNRHVLELNRKKLITCLSKLIVCMYHFVLSVPDQLLTVNILLDGSFIDNQLYKHIMIEALRDFLDGNRIWKDIKKDKDNNNSKDSKNKDIKSKEGMTYQNMEWNL